MRIVIDLDGVICRLKKDTQTYADVKPLKGAKEKLKKLKEDGHYIIIQTARHMLTTNNNMGLINKKIGKITLDWLEKYEIPYDEIYFGKPYGDIYIDDSAKEFSSWESIECNSINSKKINIVIPMAGRGSRFKDAKFKEPKPLIKVKGKFMFEWAVESFKEIIKKEETKLIFIILKDHAKEFNLKKIIKEKYPKSKIVELDEVTRGQAETVLKAKKFINNYNRLIIFNTDTYFNSSALNKIINNPKVDGAIPCFEIEKNNSKYSFVKIEKGDYVTEVAEKKQISNFASNGAYYFKEGRKFVSACEEMIEHNEKTNHEFYVMPVYQKLIENGLRIKMVRCDKNWILGTPKELKFFKENYDEQ